MYETTWFAFLGFGFLLFFEPAPDNSIFLKIS